MGLYNISKNDSNFYSKPYNFFFQLCIRILVFSFTGKNSFERNLDNNMFHRFNFVIIISPI